MYRIYEGSGQQQGDGTNIQQWEKLGGSPQEWRIVAAENGYCRIMSMADESKCIAVAENSGTNGLNVQLATYTGKENQLWKLIKNGSSYGIVSKCSGDKAGLDVFELSTDNGGNIDQWEYWGGDCQLWKISPVYPAVNDGAYTVRNVNSGLFAADINGNAVQSQAQPLTFKTNADGTYTILNANGSALTVENNSAEDGANISFAKADNSTSQKFSLRANADGSYSILTASSGNKRCVDVYEISLDDGANLCQWEYWGGDGQKFILEPAKADSKVKGDVNADGKFNISDLVMMQKWLVRSGSLTDWMAGDLVNDGVINVFDLAMMKKMLIAQK